MANEKSDNLALLIDGDNISPKYIVGLMAEIANYGTASVRRIYGDWTQPDLKGWKHCLLDHSILPMQQFSYTNHKNSTDGAMIIDAMDLLYTNRFSSFCLVSSDSDFTRLAARIREQGVTVYGFGERKTPPALVAACTKFVYLDVLEVPDVPPSGPEERLVVSQTSPNKQFPSMGAVSLPQTVVRVQTLKRPIDQVALVALEKAVNNSSIDEDSYANLAEVGERLRKISPDLNARNYGYDRLLDFVKASGIVELKWKHMGNNAPVALVRLRRKFSEASDY